MGRRVDIFLQHNGLKDENLIFVTKAKVIRKYKTKVSLMGQSCFRNISFSNLIR